MRIVLLGASGNAGREIARLLSPRLSDHDELVLAGRNAERLQATASQCSGPAAVRVAFVDAEDDEAVRTLIAGAGLVVVTASVPHRVPVLARLVAEAGADWYDTLLSSKEKTATLRELEPLIRSAGLCFVTDGGFHPGLPAAMVRWAARRIDALQTAVVYGGMRLDWRAETLSESTIAEMLGEFADFDLMTYVDGAWRALRWSECPKVDFGLPIGTKSCVPMYLAEMESLPTDIPTLRRCGFFVSGFSPLMDYAALPVIMALGRVPAWRAATIRFARWSVVHLASYGPPNKLVVRLEASGLNAGRPATARLEISGDDGYLITAAPVVVGLGHVLDRSSRQPGLYFQAHLVDPDALVDELETLGLTVTSGT